MFDLSNARHVRRDELHSPAESPRESPGPELDDLLRLRLDAEYAFTTADIVLPDASDAEDEAELRLFATPANAAPQTHKIRLSSPGAANADPGFLIKKPRSYYFARDPTAEEQAALHAAAVDGDTVVERSRELWPGCALPWKVRTLPAAGTRRAMLATRPSALVLGEEKVHKRTRKGKKTRIAIRKKLQASKERHDAQARLAKEKEEAEREKRTRRNREKKLKKKAKGQAKKLSVEAVDSHKPTEAEQDNSVHSD